ncbi:MAG: glycosyltransferase family 39 protein [Deltaproteobacteria bacterium]|nr:glycosyltransferase family 39 protein [Deltaproteobacteria bacterium]
MIQLLLWILLLLVPVNMVKAEQIIPPGREDYFISIIKPYDTGIGSYKLKNIWISKDNVRYEFCSRDCFYVILEKRSNVINPVAVTRNFGIYVVEKPPDLNIDSIIETIVKNDSKDIFEATYDYSRADLQIKFTDLRVIYLLLILWVLIAILSINKKTSRITSEKIDKLEIYIGKIYYLLFILIVLLSANLRFRNLHLPLVEEGSALRLLYSYDSWIYNLFISNDPRHPGLYFALVKPFILLSKEPEYAARMFSAFLSVLSVTVIGLLVRSSSKFNSLMAMLLLALHPEYIYRSREITDISLYVLNSLLSLHFLIKSENSDKRIYKILFALFTVLSCLSSYAAYFNLFSILLYILLTKRLKDFVWYIVTGLLFVLPYIYKILTSLRRELFIKGIAEEFPHILWGKTTLSNFVGNTLSVLFAGEFTVSILLLLVIHFILNYKKNNLHLLFLLTFVANMLFMPLSIIFRMMPYYFIFLPISFILLISYQKNETVSLPNRLSTLLILLFSLFAFFYTLRSRFETIYVQGFHLRNNPKMVVERVKSLGIKNIVIDIEYNKTVLGYYFFERPFETLIKKDFEVSDDGKMILKESFSNLSITSLTRTIDISEGWEKRSLERLMRLDYEKFGFIYDKKLPNKDILDYLYKECHTISLGEKYIVFLCSSRKTK